MRRAIALGLITLAACGPSEPVDIDAAAPTPDAWPPLPDAFVPVDAYDGRCAWGGGCDLDRDACPTGQSCMPWPTATVCGPAGSAAAGAACASTTDCEAGAMCVPYNDGSRICRPIVCDTSTCGDGVDPFAGFYRISASTRAGFCGDFWCTPFPDSCPVGRTCRLQVDSWIICSEGIGTTLEGGPCTSEGDCGAGLVCTGTCVRMCQSDADCTGHCLGMTQGVGYCDS